MSEFPSGVAVITAMDNQGQPWGMTCSALCSLCLDPLHSRAQDTAALFGSSFSTPTRFDDTTWQDGPAGPHITQDAHAIADCCLSRTVDGGTQTIFVRRGLRHSDPRRVQALAVRQAPLQHRG
jgi:flavin reductase (DIM6/NTAB) family NADH-FMN oxidoreductase RutF